MATVFQAECHAIINGLSQLDSVPNDEVTVLTDNQAVVKSLANPNTTTKTVKLLKATLNHHATHRKITVRWIRAHVGHYGNELADEQAKQGSTHQTHGPEPLAYLSKSQLNSIIHAHSTREWQERWNNRKDSRQSAIFFPDLDPKRSKDILNLPKNKIGLVVRALTGHDHRTRHNSILEGAQPPPCRLCKTHVETPSHLIISCPALLHHRAFTFKSYTADIVRTWSVEQLTAFLSTPSIVDMEQDGLE